MGLALDQGFEGFGAWKIGMCIVQQGIVEGSSLVVALHVEGRS